MTISRGSVEKTIVDGIATVRSMNRRPVRILLSQSSCVALFGKFPAPQSMLVLPLEAYGSTDDVPVVKIEHINRFGKLQPVQTLSCLVDGPKQKR